MYLKRLELHGFKTFATRTVLDFEGGVTAVVGPNGSGKSNLADAVRWALGEQNMRNVRARQSDDLIFAGASGAAGRPGGRAPMAMAEVLLTFDNSAGWLPVDYQEVRVGRRVYRGGENEYVLNGARVRLRDVADLLARASIGASGHIVIGQGLIDMVLSQRPEERRALVETLAGLRFYYGRRDDAEAKLRAAESNLLNVDAMIAEGTPHLATLREQAAACEQYHGVERELRDLLLIHYAHAHAQAGEKRVRLARDKAAAEAALLEVQAQAQQAEQEVAGGRERVRLLAGTAADMRRLLRAAHDERDATERELAVSRARREAELTQLESLRQDVPTLVARQAQAAAELHEAHGAVQTVAAESARLQQAQGAIEAATRSTSVELAQAERAQRELAQRRRDLERDETAAQTELAALVREEAAAERDQDRLAMEVQRATAGLTAAETALAASRAALSTATAANEQARRGDADARRTAAAALRAAQAASDARRTRERQLAELQARAGGLRAWLGAVAGGADGPTVAAALVVGPDVSPAVAAALGPLLAARPAPYGLDAPAASSLLANGARGVLLEGRARLGAAQQATLLERAVACGVARASIVGWGDAVAGYEGTGAAAQAVRDALSTVLVVRDLDALWLVRQGWCDAPDADRVTVATLRGEALLASGLLRRAAPDMAEALGRARELRQVEREASAAETARSAAVATAAQAEHEQGRTASLAEEAARLLRTAEHDANARRSEVAVAERAVAQARREAQWVDEQRQRAAQAEAARARRHAAAEKRLHAARGGLAALSREEGPAHDRFARARSALQEATARRAEHGAATAQIAERMAAANRRQRAAQGALAHADDDLRARRALMERLSADTRGRQEAEATLAAGAEECAVRLQRLNERLRPLEDEMAALEARGAELEARLAELRATEAGAATAHEGAALALQRADHELETVQAGLEADLALAAADLPAPLPPPAGLHGRLRALRARLSSFGPINARAPDDLAVAAERQQFLETQAADLRDGIAMLRRIIAETNATVRERFSAMAGELDAQFRLYVQRLFGGGRGELTALYDEAGLPGGLDVVAQPPGKRTSDLALLSGGERALVGLALVFAMLAVRPIPFCILDEAEAALDEANTLRVGEILRDLSARTQCVVITHNRGTMSHADSLYGVTMAETGVSQIAGLRLEDVDAARQSRAG